MKINEIVNEMKSEDTTLKQWDQKNLVPGNDTNLDVKINVPKHLHKIQSHKEGQKLKLYTIIFHFSPPGLISQSSVSRSRGASIIMIHLIMGNHVDKVYYAIGCL